MVKIKVLEERGYKEKQRLQHTEQIKDLDVLEQIYTDPMAILNDDNFMLENVIPQGYHGNALCEALGVERLIIEIEDNEYTLAYCKPPHGLEHYDLMFNTEKAQRAPKIIV